MNKAFVLSMEVFLKFFMHFNCFLMRFLYVYIMYFHHINSTLLSCHLPTSADPGPHLPSYFHTSAMSVGDLVSF